MKYVIVEYIGLEMPFIFPIFWNHVDIAEFVKERGGKPISAGIVKMGDNKQLYCTGKSVTMGLSSRGDEDLKVLNKHLTFEL